MMFHSPSASERTRHATPSGARPTSVVASPSAPDRAVRYSAAPLCTIDTSALADSRFILPARGRLPYRDASGRVNINLCQHSLREHDETLGDDESAKLKLLAWERHAQRAIASRPADELKTLDELVAEHDAEEEKKHEALPLSLRKPRRGASQDLIQHATTPRPSSTHALLAPLPDETIVVLPSPTARTLEEFEECTVTPVVAMQRRLFAAPQPGDEPTPDTYYLRTLEERHRLPSSDDEDVWEVDRILKEDEESGRFLIRWEGFGPESDTWEPEQNIAPQLVASFRQRCLLVCSHAGDDFMLGRTKMLWCASCSEHQPADSFSTNQRRAAACMRTCLNHHYRVGPSASPFDTPRRLAKRDREEDLPSPLGLLPPPLPKRPARPVARSLSARHADFEVSRCRLYGFSTS